MFQTQTFNPGDLAVAPIIVDGQGTVVDRPVLVMAVLGSDDVLVRIMGMLTDDHGLNGMTLALPVSRLTRADW